MKIVKNIWVYYMLILFPLAGLFIGLKYLGMSSILFAVGIILYTTVYRSFIDRKRLYYKNILPEKENYNRVIPAGFYARYFKELYLKP